MRAGSALLCRGPCAAVRLGRKGPQGVRQGCRTLFAGAGAPSKSPAETHAPGGQDARRAPHRGGLSFGYFSLATQRKVTRAPTGARNPGRRPAISPRAHGNTSSPARLAGTSNAVNANPSNNVNPKSLSAGSEESDSNPNDSSAVSAESSTLAYIAPGRSAVCGSPSCRNTA